MFWNTGECFWTWKHAQSHLNKLETAYWYFFFFVHYVFILMIAICLFQKMIAICLYFVSAFYQTLNYENHLNVFSLLLYYVSYYFFLFCLLSWFQLVVIHIFVCFITVTKIFLYLFSLFWKVFSFFNFLHITRCNARAWY